MFTPETLEVVMVSFEGPDQYSQAGGLGVRARELCRAFAALGFRTTLVFVGDPDKPGMEMDRGVQLVRWCQQISDRYRAGVYEGELAKIRDLTATLPAQLIDTVIRPAAQVGRTVAVLCEEWHTAWFCRSLSDRLHALGLRRNAVLLWNANNTFGFEAIDWPILEFVASVTTVSKYMKHLMWPFGVNPVGIPNGIPESALAPVDASAAGAIRAGAGTPCLTFKIGRFSPDKRWNQAVAAIAELRAEGMTARLLIRGGMEPYGATVLAFAAECGLAVTDWHEPVVDAGGGVRALTDTDDAPIVHLRRFLPDQVITEINVAADAVLANSGHEPFGLVGLEAMAAGGIAMVGATDDPAEIASALSGLVEQPALGERLRLAARRDAADFSWPLVIAGLLERLRFMCLHQRVLLPADGSAPLTSRPAPRHMI